MKRFLLPVFAFCFSYSSHADCGARYMDSIFGLVKHSDIQYGSNTDSKNQPTTLLLDVYEPDADTANMRPLMIFVHGGSFVGGSRQDQHIDRTAEFFAHKGYVTANIEYRVEQNVLITPYLQFADKNQWYRAMIRAYHDLKAAIRYFKKDVASNGNSYRIDTTKIILYGSSAGAITALNTTFIDDTGDMTPSFKYNADMLGGIDGNSGNPGYSSTRGIKAIVSCSGAMDNVECITNNTDISYIGFHNNPDLVVPYDLGCYDLVFCHLGYYYGDKRVDMKAQSLHMNSEFHSINYVGHPADEYDSVATRAMILQKSTAFLYNVLCNSATYVRNNWTVKNIEVFPNPSRGAFTVQLPVKIAVDAIVKIYNVTGVEVFKSTMRVNSSFEISAALTNGSYFIEIQPSTNESISYIGKFSVIRE